MTPLDRLQQIGRIPLGLYPTPLQELARLRSHLNVRPRLLIKRDDLAGPGFGGNKIRKLEYYFSKALRQGYDSVITCGAETSNHCRITAAIAAQTGLECHLVLSPASQSGVPASLFLDEIYGASIHRVADSGSRASAMAELSDSLRAAGRHPMEIPLGASTPLGALGFVRAISELESAPGVIFHSSSSGGTQAGLLAGLRLYGFRDTHLVGVSAGDTAAEVRESVQSILSGLELMLELPARTLLTEIHVEERFAGPGYGIPSPESQEALRLLGRTEGIVLDPVYTAKAFAGMLAYLREGRLDSSSSVMFWHTGGQLALFSATPP
ncbi:MAG: D-cysteine desulfhydrase family protein [Candidatus Solibacter usitatus]|nr:D-cysteine desulfhydrase family protein [Candidatus Solibacter usitatus]